MPGWSWAEHVAAHRRYRIAVERLLRQDYRPALRRALESGPPSDYRAAVELLTRERPPAFVRDNLDVLLRLAIQGGAEQGAIREVLEAFDPAAVSAALPALIDRSLAAPTDRYLETCGLLDLLDHLGETALLARVVRTAADSDDPDLREVAESYAGRGGDGGEDRSEPRPTARPAPVDAPVSPPAAEAWREFVSAWYAQASSRTAALSEDYPTLLERRLADGSDRDAVIAFLAFLVQMEAGAGDRGLADVLASAEPDRLIDLWPALVDEVLADPRLAAERYERLLSIVSRLPIRRLLPETLDRGRSSSDVRVRRAAQAWASRRR